MPGVVFDIQSYAIYDGPGIRTAVFLGGCPLRCGWCHNPESQGAPGARAGEVMDAATVVDRVLADRPFYDDSGGGVTLTGGEPTMQPTFLWELLDAFRRAELHVALETCGHFSRQLVDSLADGVDLFLFDLKHIDPEVHRRGTGVDNARILDNFVGLLERVGAGRIIPRLPLIPGFSADPGSIDQVVSFLGACGYIDQAVSSLGAGGSAGEVHLMPYHRLAKAKVDRIEGAMPFWDAPPLPPEDLAALVGRVQDRGIAVRCHG